MSSRCPCVFAELRELALGGLRDAGPAGLVTVLPRSLLAMDSSTSR